MSEKPSTPMPTSWRWKVGMRMTRRNDRRKSWWTTLSGSAAWEPS
jgi:hypothetical protein